MKKKLFTAMIAAMTITTTMSMPLLAATKTQASNGMIDKKQAIEIALNDAELTEDQVTITKSHLDYDDGIQEYEIEFLKGNMEYDYDINAKTGAIVSSDQEVEDDVVVAAKVQKAKQNEKAKAAKKSGEITREEALDIAIKDAGISKDDITRTEVHKDRDDGVTKYEVEIHVGQKEYSYDIGVKNGKILESDVEIDD